MPHRDTIQKQVQCSARALVRAGPLLEEANAALLISKRWMRKAESIGCLRLERDIARQNLGFSSRSFVLCGLPVRMPAWAKAAVDRWTVLPGINADHLFHPIE